MFYKWDQVYLTNNWGVKVMGTYFDGSTTVVFSSFLISCNCPCSLVFPLNILPCLCYFWFLKSQNLTSVFFSWVSEGQILLPFSVLSSTFSLPFSFWCCKSGLLHGNYELQSLRTKEIESVLFLNDYFEKYSLQNFF